MWQVGNAAIAKYCLDKNNNVTLLGFGSREGCIRHTANIQNIHAVN